MFVDAPYFPSVETNFNIKENESMLLSFEAVGKPDVEAYTWFYKGLFYNTPSSVDYTSSMMAHLRCYV